MQKNKTNVVLLGSTGSIGQQTLDIVRDNPDKFLIIGLAAGNNIEILIEQINEFKPKFIYSLEKTALPSGTDYISMSDMATHSDTDLVIVATTGRVGLNPVLAAVKTRKRIAIANKEVLVMAGEIIMSQASKYRAQILPIDSEHSAIWQCLQGEDTEISRIILTASGGPFYRYDKSDLEYVSVEQTLKHPTWKMGKKVTIDSATLMNKGLEIIEAHWLFSVPYHKIEVVIHPSSIIHSLVQFIDGSVKAQMSIPDMHLPIQYALSYPHRLFNKLPQLDLAQINALTFEIVSYDKFPCLSLALEAGKEGGTCPAVLCAADEIAVQLFLEKRIGFTDIAKIVSETLDKNTNKTNPSLEEILEADRWARETAMEVYKQRDFKYTGK